MEEDPKQNTAVGLSFSMGELASFRHRSSRNPTKSEVDAFLKLRVRLGLSTDEKSSKVMGFRPTPVSF